ncbi:MAG: ECF-type sigma factor [Rubrivivax sp.]
MGELTTLFAQARGGDGAALGRLYTLLYDELRRIAHARLRAAPGESLLGTTALVHESYLRLLKAGALQVGDRPHFLAYAARAMRSIVVDQARQRLSGRRGGDRLHLTLDTLADVAASRAASDDEVVRVHEALDALAAADARLASVVEMRYFAGLDDAEIAAALGLSARTVGRDWAKARLMLYAMMKDG